MSVPFKLKTPETQLHDSRVVAQFGHGKVICGYCAALYEYCSHWGEAMPFAAATPEVQARHAAWLLAQEFGDDQDVTGPRM